jgi:hypothetical protein
LNITGSLFGKGDIYVELKADLLLDNIFEALKGYTSFRRMVFTYIWPRNVPYWDDYKVAAVNATIGPEVDFFFLTCRKNWSDTGYEKFEIHDRDDFGIMYFEINPTEGLKAVSKYVYPQSSESPYPIARDHQITMENLVGFLSDASGTDLSLILETLRDNRLNM